MKATRNRSISKIFWTSLVLLLILGIILKLLGLGPITFPEEDSSSSSSTASAETSSPNENPSINHGSFDITFEEEVKTEDSFINEHENTQETNQETSIETEVNQEENETESIPETKDEIPSISEIESTPSENITPIGTIYLTFDDGPSLECTPQILDILKNNNITATFFILDYKHESEKENLIVRAFEEGHTIALHGTSHTYSEIYSSLEDLIENFETLQEKVYQTLGYRPKFIRFPGGSSNTVSKHYCTGIMTEAVQYFSSSEFVYFDWNVDSQDAGGAYSAGEIFNNVTSSIKPGRNNVVLMHDSKNKTYTVEALQQIIDWAFKQGYEFKSITEDTPQVTHRIAN